MVKELDAVGRIVIPKDLREQYGIKKAVELIPTTEGILIKKASKQ